jgi:PAS domain S-box-containing protein
MQKCNILFLSKGNSVRSQIAEAFARQMLKDEVTVYSAGVGLLLEIDPITLDVMKNHGIDISKQCPQSITELKNIHFDLAITLSTASRKDRPALTGAPIFLHWSVEDPLGSLRPEYAPIWSLKRNSDLSVKFSESEKAELQISIQRCAEKIKALVYELSNSGYLDAFVVHKKNDDRIFNSLSDGIIAHDLNKKVIMFSQKASSLTGISEELALDKSCDDIFGYPLCGDECSCSEPGKIDDFETKNYNTSFLDVNGVRKECKVTVVPMRDEDGKIQGVVASLNDITSQKTLERLLARESSFGGIVGNDVIMQHIFQEIRDVSSYDYPVHIFGETGTGKDLIAKAIHNESRRKNKPFIPINCGALPEGLIESELFGHVRGAFTDAIRDKKGRFEMADGGTLFLDEITDLPKMVQIKLLRCLQEGMIERVGSEKSIKTDVRIVSATNKDLKNAVDEGNFREDLYYRLNVIPMEIPPLRNRKNDIPLLCKHFLEKAFKGNNDVQLTLSGEALNQLLDYNWPGNVRELENAINFAIVKCQTDTIQIADLPQEVRKMISSSPSNRSKLQKQAVIDALRASGGNKVKAAKLLGIGRATLYRFLERHPEIKYLKNASSTQ